jgi:sec-independent protein translocase protein TatB
MFVVLVVAMIIFGPSRLPELAGQVGRWVRDFRRMSSDLTGEFEKTFAEVEEVKKSFKRELNSIQDEVEGVGKSARGDLKKSPTKGLAAKKPAALKAGTASSASKPTPAFGSKARGATGTPLSGLLGKNGKSNGAEATKADPLADVSFLETDFVAVKGTALVATNGKASIEEDDALIRVRKRRAAAAYARRVAV